MNDLEIKFKADTGHSAIVEIKSVYMTEELDTYPLNDCDNVTEVINLIDSMDYDLAIPIGKIPDEFIDDYDLKIYRTEYVEWLQEQLNLKL